VGVTNISQTCPNVEDEAHFKTCKSLEGTTMRVMHPAANRSSAGKGQQQPFSGLDCAELRSWWGKSRHTREAHLIKLLPFFLNTESSPLKKDNSHVKKVNNCINNHKLLNLI
jgi:hypothetical protein